MSFEIFAKRIQISGVVQGVGFRPFLFGLAKIHHLQGEVSNTARGVDLLVEGPLAALDAFLRDIPLKKPVLSRIAAIESRIQPVQGFSTFTIVKSRDTQSRFTLISPDVSICPDCLGEMLNPDNRRFEYPFINCTNCGPRYTIIQDIPYDRPKTSMKDFPMCPDCLAEYENPLDRRFHAQPNACPLCGPQITLTDNKGRPMDRDPGHALDLAAQLLGKGKILAVKGLGGFHLACDASDERAVALLRKLKNRPDKPFALMASVENSLFDHVHIDEDERVLLNSFHRPIVLLEKKKVNDSACPVPGLAPSLAPCNTCLGVMLPYTPLHYLLLSKGPDILVMTSGNRSGEPLSIDNDDALDALAHIADYFLFHNRDIYFRADDSIARVQKGTTRFLRRSRGYAPLPVELKTTLAPFSGNSLPRVLGCGGGMKSAVCLTRDQYGFLSQHIGDLDHPKFHEFYTRTIDHMEKILDINPQAVAHDLHPGYLSTQFALELGKKGIPLVPVQHHHAHALSCMAENQLEGEVMALTLDGTGLGIDGNIWGGEILTCTYTGFKRRARLAWLPMPGGDAAVLEPWRMAASLLYKTFGRDFLDLDIPYITAMDEKKLGFLIQMMDKGVNSPLTSSTGRLFDAVSSLNCVRHEISHDSQAAMELEALAVDQEAFYPFDLGEDDTKGSGGSGCSGCRVMDHGPAVRQMVDDIRNNVPVGRISDRFHAGLVHVFTQTADLVRKETGLNRVVLSGGVFNNDKIFTRTVDCLETMEFEVFTHSQVPCGDGGLALGQAMAAAVRLAMTDNNMIQKN